MNTASTVPSPTTHAVANHLSVLLMQAAWVPLVSALAGAVVGAGISWLALVWNAKNELKRMQAQARRALQIEMYMNAEMLKTIARAIKQRSAALAGSEPFLRGVLDGRKFNEAFRDHFTEAMDGVSWEAAGIIHDAYASGQATFAGTLINNMPPGALVTMCCDTAMSFTDSINALREYVQMPDTFYETVARLRQDCEPLAKPRSP